MEENPLKSARKRHFKLLLIGLVLSFVAAMTMVQVEKGNLPSKASIAAPAVTVSMIGIVLLFISSALYARSRGYPALLGLGLALLSLVAWAILSILPDRNPEAPESRRVPIAPFPWKTALLSGVFLTPAAAIVGFSRTEESLIVAWIVYAFAFRFCFGKTAPLLTFFGSLGGALFGGGSALAIMADFPGISRVVATLISVGSVFALGIILTATSYWAIYMIRAQQADKTAPSVYPKWLWDERLRDPD